MKKHKRTKSKRKIRHELQSSMDEKPISASCDGNSIAYCYKSDLTPLKRKKGFTLIEIMVCVAIIGILASLAMPNYLRYVERSRELATEHNTEMLNLAVQDYMIRQNAIETSFFTYPVEKWEEIDSLVTGGLAGCEVKGYTFDVTGLNVCYMSQIIFKGATPEQLYTKQ